MVKRTTWIKVKESQINRGELSEEIKEGYWRIEASLRERVNTNKYKCYWDQTIAITWNEIQQFTCKESALWSYKWWWRNRVLWTRDEEAVARTHAITTRYVIGSYVFNLSTS